MFRGSGIVDPSDLAAAILAKLALPDPTASEASPIAFAVEVVHLLLGVKARDEALVALLHYAVEDLLLVVTRIQVS